MTANAPTTSAMEKTLKARNSDVAPPAELAPPRYLQPTNASLLRSGAAPKQIMTRARPRPADVPIQAQKKAYVAFGSTIPTEHKKAEVQPSSPPTSTGGTVSSTARLTRRHPTRPTDVVTSNKAKRVPVSINNIDVKPKAQVPAKTRSTQAFLRSGLKPATGSSAPIAATSVARRLAPVRDASQAKTAKGISTSTFGADIGRQARSRNIGGTARRTVIPPPPKAPTVTTIRPPLQDRNSVAMDPRHRVIKPDSSVHPSNVSGRKSIPSTRTNMMFKSAKPQDKVTDPIVRSNKRGMRPTQGSVTMAVKGVKDHMYAPVHVKEVTSSRKAIAYSPHAGVSTCDVSGNVLPTVDYIGPPVNAPSNATSRLEVDADKGDTLHYEVGEGQGTSEEGAIVDVSYEATVDKNDCFLADSAIPCAESLPCVKVSDKPQVLGSVDPVMIPLPVDGDDDISLSTNCISEDAGEHGILAFATPLPADTVGNSLVKLGVQFVLLPEIVAEGGSSAMDPLPEGTKDNYTIVPMVSLPADAIEDGVISAHAIVPIPEDMKKDVTNPLMIPLPEDNVDDFDPFLLHLSGVRNDGLPLLTSLSEDASNDSEVLPCMIPLPEDILIEEYVDKAQIAGMTARVGFFAEPYASPASNASSTAMVNDAHADGLDSQGIQKNYTLEFIEQSVTENAFVPVKTPVVDTTAPAILAVSDTILSINGLHQEQIGATIEVEDSAGLPAMQAVHEVGQNYWKSIFDVSDDELSSFEGAGQTDVSMDERELAKIREELSRPMPEPPIPKFADWVDPIIAMTAVGIIPKDLGEFSGPDISAEGPIQPEGVFLPHPAAAALARQDSQNWFIGSATRFVSRITGRTASASNVSSATLPPTSPQPPSSPVLGTPQHTDSDGSASSTSSSSPSTRSASPESISLNTAPPVSDPPTDLNPAASGFRRFVPSSWRRRVA